MANLATLFHQLAVKAGVSVENKDLKHIVTSNTLAEIEIPEDIQQAIDSQLISMDAAKNNQALKSHYFAQALNGVDAETNRIMDEYGFDDDVKMELVAEKSSMKRVKLLADKIKALEEKKAGATKKDQPDLTAKIHELQREKAEVIKAMEQKLQDIQTQHVNEITNMQIRNILASKNYATSHLPAEVNLTTADILLQKELSAAGAKIIRDNGALKLVNASDSNMEYYDKNSTRPTVEQFIDGVLAQNKLLAVSNGQAAGNGQSPMTNGQQSVNQQAQQTDTTGKYDDWFNQSITDFQKGSVPVSVPV